MSRIDELVTAFEGFRRSRDEYVETCRDFAARLREGFVKFMECADEDVKFFPPSNGYEPPRPGGGRSYSELAAMEMGANGYWRIGLALHLRGVGVVTYELLFRYRDAAFEVIFESDDFIVLKDLDRSGRLFIRMFNATKRFYENYLQDVLTGEGPRRVVGFLPARDDENMLT